MDKFCTVDIVNGYVINQIRLEAGFKKQADLGEKFQMTHAAIGKIERGESSVNIEFLLMLAELIGTSISNIMLVMEELLDYLVSQEVMFLTAQRFEMIDDDDKVTLANFEEYITLELKRSVRNLVEKKPDLDVQQLQNQFNEYTSKSSAFVNHPVVVTTASSLVAAAIVTNPLIGLGVGATLLASKIMKSKKAP